MQAPRLQDVSFLQDDDPEEQTPGFGVARLSNVLDIFTLEVQPTKQFLAGLERMIRVAKDSTNPTGAKFGPDLDFLGLNNNISWHNTCHQS